MRKLAKWAIVALGLPMVLIQVVRPERANPPVDRSASLESRVEVPSNVATILDRSCKDCHSNETRWPWYSGVAPISWYVARDVANGRAQLNFSEWARYSSQQADARLIYIAYAVQTKTMPLGSYLRVHPEARLSEDDVAALSTWAEQNAR